MSKKHEVLIATANNIGRIEYGLEVGRFYKVVKTDYGVNVHDISTNGYITRTKTNAFDNYKKFKESKE